MAEIRPVSEPGAVQRCARMMAVSEPWMTLGRGYEDGLSLLGNPDRELYGAWENREIVGFIFLDMRSSFRGYIQTLCVHPESRGRGVGTALIEWAEARILRDSPNVFLCVSSFNSGALRLYQRLGYVIIGELPDFLVNGYSEILLRKTTGSWADFRAED